MKKTRQVTWLLLTMSIGSTAFASGWNDFSLTIAPGYEIVRANSFEIGLEGSGGFFIYLPERGGKSGPIRGYIVSPTHIFLRTTGQKPRNKFAGDSYMYADPSVEFFFVVDRSDDSLRGPLTPTEFSADPDTISLGTPKWTVPKNPHPERAYAGQLMFLGITAMVFGLPLLLVAVVVFALYRLVRRKKGSATT